MRGRERKQRESKEKERERGREGGDLLVWIVHDKAGVRVGAERGRVFREKLPFLRREIPKNSGIVGALVFSGKICQQIF